MEMQFFEEDKAPKPPEEVCFVDAVVEILPDGRRVRLTMDITPFQLAPNLEVSVADPDGKEVANASIIGTMGPRMSLVLHLRGQLTSGRYALQMEMGYPEHPVVDQKSIHFNLSGSESV